MLDGLSSVELPRPANGDPERFPHAYPTPKQLTQTLPGFSQVWQPIGPFPNAFDYFRDQSFYIIDAPGHLFGHLNCLIRTGPSKWVYLAGDACHHPDLLSGKRQIATWKDAHGGCGCVHADKEATEVTLERIRALARLKRDEVEVVLAHDLGWRAKNGSRFLPGHL